MQYARTLAVPLLSFCLPVCLSIAGCGSDGVSPAGENLPDLGTAAPDMAHGGPMRSEPSISHSLKSVEESETHVAAGSNGYVCVTYIAEQANGGSSNGYRFST